VTEGETAVWRVEESMLPSQMDASERLAENLGHKRRGGERPLARRMTGYLRRSM